MEAFKKEIEEKYTDVKVVQVNYGDGEESIADMLKNTLETYPALKGIFCTNEDMADQTLDALADKYNIDVREKAFKGLIGKGVIEGNKVILVKPQTYMNLSGESVRELVNYYKVDPESELIVVYDDISLAPGQIRIRKKGSAGGHNGIKNIIANLGTDHFMRVKVGVGEKPKNWDLADYVLSPFTKDERPLVNLAIEHAAKAIEQMLNGDVDAAMNEYNRKSANPAE